MTIRTLALAALVVTFAAPAWAQAPAEAPAAFPLAAVDTDQLRLPEADTPTPVFALPPHPDGEIVVFGQTVRDR